ncbi:hypothetical protein C8R46DRAFT_524650 [Mycena filopes]|nr:hypothetical protein C8R46DRAFT_524650 [Mycena filopes]
MLWRKTLKDNFQGELPVNAFFDEYLPKPSTETEVLIAAMVKQSTTQFAKAGAAAAIATKESGYDTLFVKYLEAIVSKFPAATKPPFLDTHGVKFAAIDEEDHQTSPDITGGQPGGTLTKDNCTWGNAGTVLELKTHVHIFKDGEIKDAEDPQNALMQLAKSARSLMAGGRCCFAFVVAVVKTQARILRFDRSGFRTSAAFDWTKKENAHLIPTFLWRLYNPATPRNHIYGADPTVSIPTPDEAQKMFKLWQETSSYEKTPPAERLSFAAATRDSRWLKASKNGADVRCFTIGRPLFQSEGLFSRATRVDRVVIEDDPEPTVYALKDAWRQACRRPETDYYDVIAKHCEVKGHSTEGMARCLGSLEFPEHKTISGAQDAQQRCHIRSLLTPVGLPLNKFPSSKQLILALQNALAHHEIAHEAGVMHRDISEGNVLFDEATGKGFLVDWDYAEFNEVGKTNWQNWFPERAAGDKYTDFHKSLKDFTGTFPFVAIELLENENLRHEPWHDLESFYWLLIWVILRYTYHGHDDGNAACHNLFDAAKPADAKRTWLSVRTPQNHSLLFELAIRLRQLILGQNPPRLEQDPQTFSLPPGYQHVMPTPTPATNVTHKSMAFMFQQVVALESWATFKDAAAVPYTRPRIKAAGTQRTNTGSQLQRFAIQNSHAISIGSGGGSNARSGSSSKRKLDSGNTASSGDDSPEPPSKKSKPPKKSNKASKKDQPSTPRAKVAGSGRKKASGSKKL